MQTEHGSYTFSTCAKDISAAAAFLIIIKSTGKLFFLMLWLTNNKDDRVPSPNPNPPMPFVVCLMIWFPCPPSSPEISEKFTKENINRIQQNVI